MLRSVWFVPALVFLASCRADAPVGARDADVVVVNPQLWFGAPLRLVSAAFRGSAHVVVLVDDTSLVDTSLVRIVGTDTLEVSAFWYWTGGWHTVTVRLGDRTMPATPFEVHGFTEWGTPLRLVGRPLALGQGSSKFWVGTNQGLAILDARWPTRPPVLVDSAVDVSCLWSISPVSGGGAVTADRGCGTLRARRYGVVTTDVDSGPRAAGWQHAVFGRPGLWLLVGSDSLGIAIRQGDGSWRWTYYHWSAQASRVTDSEFDVAPAISPDGRLAIAGRRRSDPWNRWPAADDLADLLAFDLETGSLLYRKESAEGPAFGFSPTGDTLAAVEGSNLVLHDSRTGSRLAALPVLSWSLYADRSNSTYWGPLLWDPYGPWLYLRVPNGCPALLVIDRRTWAPAGLFGPGSDVPECDAVIAVSGFTRTGWALEILYQNTFPYFVVPFTIPDP
jgi:hypothetical protein